MVSLSEKAILGKWFELEKLVKYRGCKHELVDVTFEFSFDARYSKLKLESSFALHNFARVPAQGSQTKFVGPPYLPFPVRVTGEPPYSYTAWGKVRGLDIVFETNPSLYGFFSTSFTLRILDYKSTKGKFTHLLLYEIENKVPFVLVRDLDNVDPNVRLQFEHKFRNSQRLLVEQHLHESSDEEEEDD